MPESYERYQYDPSLDVDALGEEGCGRLMAELKKARKLYEDLNTIFEDSRDGFFVTDGQANVIRVNRAYEDMAGVKREDLLGKNMRELEGVTISKSASLAVLATGKEVTIEQEYLNTRRTAYITSTPIYDDDGKLAMIVSNNRDFNEIDRLKQQLETTQQLANQWEEKIKAISQSQDGGQLCVNDSKMYEVLYTANKVAKTNSPVLLTGETGTGKEEIAKYVHQNSLRSNQSFFSINCAAISSNLIESELFGYEKGSFTGAMASGKLGFFEVADEGTLLLDEIGEMPLDLQTKLLRALQEGEILRVGGTRPVKVNVRVIAATNRDLLEMVKAQRFREDLYYRLNVVQIRIPPLRERKEDIVKLADFFLKKYNERYQFNKTLSQRTYSALKGYAWPGNVRELKNFIEQLVIVSDNSIISTPDLLFYRPMLLEQKNEDGVLDLKKILEQTEFEYIRKYYEELGTLKRVAEKLGVNLKTLARRKAYLEGKYAAKSESTRYPW